MQFLAQDHVADLLPSQLTSMHNLVSPNSMQIEFGSNIAIISFATALIPPAEALLGQLQPLAGGLPSTSDLPSSLPPLPSADQGASLPSLLDQASFALPGNVPSTVAVDAGFVTSAAPLLVALIRASAPALSTVDLNLALQQLLAQAQAGGMDAGAAAGVIDQARSADAAVVLAVLQTLAFSESGMRQVQQLAEAATALASSNDQATMALAGQLAAILAASNIQLSDIQSQLPSAETLQALLGVVASGQTDQLLLLLALQLQASGVTVASEDDLAGTAGGVDLGQIVSLLNTVVEASRDQVRILTAFRTPLPFAD